jgi:Acetyltransferase (GNAT) domain
MITISRKLFHLLPYQLVWFPSDGELDAVANSLSVSHMARVLCANTDLPSMRALVRRHVSLTLGLDLTRGLDDLYKRFNNNARNRIHKAQRLGDRVAVKHYRGSDGDRQVVAQFADLFNSFAANKPGRVFTLTPAIIEAFFPHADLVMAYLDGELFCGHLNLLDRGARRTRLLYSGSQRFSDQVRARMTGILNVYLHWYEMECYQKEGFRIYDLGGVNPVDDPGVNRFKVQFGGDLLRDYNYLLAGLPMLGRLSFRAFTSLTARGRRRAEVEQAADQCQEIPIDTDETATA